MAKYIDLFLPGPIDTGITAVDFQRYNSKSTARFPILIGLPSLISELMVFSTSQSLTPSFDIEFLISTDDGQSWTTELTQNIEGNTLNHIQFVGLVLPSCSLLRVRYAQNTGLIENISASLTLDQLI